MYKYNKKHNNQLTFHYSDYCREISILCCMYLIKQNYDLRLVYSL